MAGRDSGIGLEQPERHEPLPHVDEEENENEMPGDGDQGAVARNYPQGSLINTIPIFNGDSKSDVEGWIDLIERLRISQNWTPEQTAECAKNRMGGIAAKWERAARYRGKSDEMRTWDGLKSQLEKRFKVLVSATNAVNAVKDLRQAPSETVDDFLDRITIAFHKKDYGKDDTSSQAYYQALERDLFCWFSAGLLESIRVKVITGHNPPTTLETMLEAARTTETEIRQQVARGKALEEVRCQEEERAQAEAEETGPFEADPITHKSLAVQIKEMREELAALKTGKDRKNVTCFRCQGKGHYSFECKNPRVAPQPTRSAPRRRAPQRRTVRARRFRQNELGEEIPEETWDWAQGNE